MFCLLCCIVSSHNWVGVVPTFRIPSLWVSWRQTNFVQVQLALRTAYLWYYLMWPKGCFPAKIDKKVSEKLTLWIILFFSCVDWARDISVQSVHWWPYSSISCKFISSIAFWSFQPEKKKYTHTHTHSKTLSHTRVWFDFRLLWRFFTSLLMEVSVNFLFLVGT